MSSGRSSADRKDSVARVTAAVMVGLCAAAIISMWLAFFGRAEPYVFFDIDYYRNAVIDVVNGTKSMYDALPYPPFAFLVVSFLGGLPVVVGNQVWTAGTMVILVVVSLVLTLKATEVGGEDWRTDRLGLVTRTSANTLLLLISLPIISQLTAGQLSLVVIALSFIDAVGVLPRRFQGVLVGLAGAIKVTPLVFVLYYLATGQRRQAAVATGTFAATTGVAWALFPEGSAFFWTHVGKNDQFGDPGRIDNLSIRSALTRLSTDLGQSTWLWVAIGLVVVIAAMWRARRHFVRGEIVEAVLVVGASATVVAPIAWPHYFTWLPLTALWLMMIGNRRARWLGFGIYLSYSLVQLAVVIDGLMNGAALNGVWLAPLVLVSVLIPVLIGLFGLPHRTLPAPVRAEETAKAEPSAHGAPVATTAP